MMPMSKQKFTGLTIVATVAAFLVLQFCAITHSHDDENHDDHHCVWCVQLQQSKQLLHTAFVLGVYTGVFESPSGISQVCCADPDIPTARSRSPPA